MRGWAGYGFRAEPPNAALSAVDASGRRRSVVVELTNPRYDPKRHSMRYVAQTVPSRTGPLKVERGADGFAPGRLRDVSLFIDDAQGTVVDGCLLVTYTKCIAPNLRGVSLPGAFLYNVNLPGCTARRRRPVARHAYRRQAVRRRPDRRQPQRRLSDQRQTQRRPRLGRRPVRR